MICQKCGENVKEESKFCEHCGAELEKNEASEAEVYVPINYTDLLTVIPEGEDILYSTLCKASVTEYNKRYKWIAHMLITNEGVAFTRPTKKQLVKQYFIWPDVNSIASLGKMKVIQISGYVLKLTSDKNYESKENFKERINKFAGRFRPIMIEKKLDWLKENENNPLVKKRRIKYVKKWLPKMQALEAKRLGKEMKKEMKE